MTEHLLIGLAAVIVLGVSAQWLAWRIKLPSILLLLIFGFVAGPITGFVDPDALLGDLLFPVVSVSVAVILFEGGLTLRFSELPKIGGVITRLITVGAVVTWGVAAVAAHYILQLDWQLSILLGAILSVTGPTVVGPLLRQIRPKGQSAAALKWEGILIDPVGALLAVLVFEAILENALSHAPSIIAIGVLKTIVIGFGLGLLSAGIFTILMRQYWLPDQLQNGFALMLAILSFAISHELQHESGLLTVTVMGIALANQHWVSVRHVVEFKENLRVLLIGSLFILLAARLDLNEVIEHGLQGIGFLIVLIIIVRPLAVIVSTFGSELSWQERVFMSWMAPRGIVAASVASVFAFELEEVGMVGAEQLVSATFLVIVGTVAFYGLTAGPVARYLGLSEVNPQGVLIVGAHKIAREIALILQKVGFRAVLVDTNDMNVRIGKQAGLEAHYSNALTEDFLDDFDLTGLGRMLALTSNNEVNALASLHFAELFGRAEMYQLPMRPVEESHHPEPKNFLKRLLAMSENGHPETPQHFLGRFLFKSDLTYHKLYVIREQGVEVQTKKLTAEDVKVLADTPSGTYYYLFLVDNKQLLVYASDFNPTPQVGQILIYLGPKLGDSVPDEQLNKEGIGQATIA